MTELHPMFDPGLSTEAETLFRLVCHRGGSLRIGTLLKSVTAPEHRAVLCDTIGELIERYWVEATWRGPIPTPGEPYPLDAIDRLCITRFGKRKNPDWRKPQGLNARRRVPR